MCYYHVFAYPDYALLTFEPDPRTGRDYEKRMYKKPTDVCDAAPRVDFLNSMARKFEQVRVCIGKLLFSQIHEGKSIQLIPLKHNPSHKCKSNHSLI